jgi:hypothetical protein
MLSISGDEMSALSRVPVSRMCVGIDVGAITTSAPVRTLLMAWQALTISSTALRKSSSDKLRTLSSADFLRVSLKNIVLMLL